MFCLPSNIGVAAVAKHQLKGVGELFSCVNLLFIKYFCIRSWWKCVVESRWMCYVFRACFNPFDVDAWSACCLCAAHQFVSRCAGREEHLRI